LLDERKIVVEHVYIEAITSAACFGKQWRIFLAASASKPSFGHS
jgi:hypothetical protein